MVPVVPLIIALNIKGEILALFSRIKKVTKPIMGYIIIE